MTSLKIRPIAEAAQMSNVATVIPNEGHLWKFGGDGRIVEYQHVTDTATHQRVARGE